jgi:Asp-tRNA(Asn)/Glu-tRNA(Gln) amidotransferase A subunit family amidase
VTLAMARLAARAYSDNEYPVHQSEGIRHALMAYTAPLNLTGYPVATVPMRRGAGLLPRGLQIVGHRGHDNEVIEAAIEIEGCNAGSNNLKDDKDERDRNKRKPDPV